MVKGSYPPIPEHFSGELANLIDQMLVVNPKKRISTKQLLEHPVYKKRNAKYYSVGFNTSRESSVESEDKLTQQDLRQAH